MLQGIQAAMPGGLYIFRPTPGERKSKSMAGHYALLWRVGITFCGRGILDTDSGERKTIYIFLWYRIAGVSDIMAGKHQIKGYIRQDKIHCVR